MENSSRDGNTRPPYLYSEKCVCSQEATLRTGHGTMAWFQIGKRSTSRLYIVTLLIYLICRVHHANARLDELQVGIKIARRNSNILRYADDTTLMAEREEELKSLLMKVKKESDCWLKTQHSENEDQFSSVQSLSRVRLFATP